MLHEKLKIIDKSGRTSLLEIDQSKLKFVGSDGILQWVLLSKEGGVLSIDKDIQVGNTTLSKQIGAADADSGGYLQIKESSTNWVGFKAAGMFIRGGMELKGNLGSADSQNGDLYVNNLHAKTISCSGELEVSNSITAGTIKASSIDADTLIESDTISAGSIDASTSIEATTITAISSIQAGSSITAKRGSIKATNGDITASNGTISAGGSISAGTITSDGMTADGIISLGVIESTSDSIVSRAITGKNINLGKVTASGRVDVTLNVTDLNLCFLLDIPSIKGMEKEFYKGDSVPDGYFLLTNAYVDNSWTRVNNGKVANKNDLKLQDRDIYVLGICNGSYAINISREGNFEWGDWTPIKKIKGITFKITTAYQQ